jgi:hypothetical protein
MANILSVNCLTGEETVTVSNRAIIAPEDYYRDGHIEVDTNVRIAQKETDTVNAKVKLQAVEYTPLTDAEVDAITK